MFKLVLIVLLSLLGFDVKEVKVKGVTFLKADIVVLTPTDKPKTFKVDYKVLYIRLDK